MKYMLMLSTFCLLFISQFSYTQDLQGKWIMAKKNNKNSFLNVHVMQFTKDSLTHYNFDQKFSATRYSVKQNRIEVDTAAIGGFRFLDADRFRLKPERISDSIDFVRIKPTETNLSFEQIKKKHYAINYRGRTLITDFNDTLENNGPSTRLEKMSDTYFLSIYRNARRLGAIPIKKATKHKIVVYGFPEIPYQVSGEEKP